MKLGVVAKVYGGALIAYLLLDAIWLGIVARSDYQNSIGFLMREDVPYWPWVSFYLMYVAVILKLCIFTGKAPSFSRTLSHGVLLGLASYGAYNLTNYAIIQDWPLSITFKDWIWGTFVTTASALSGLFTFKFLNRTSKESE